LAAVTREIPIVHYAATQVKRLLTGNGRSPKSQIQAAICRELRLLEPPDPPDVADALAIALCHVHLSKISGIGA
jgi:crossover junction endodeoxyribonuclease RuvC